jgi:hypothetical protein
MDPDPGGPKTCGSGGSGFGSGTLHKTAYLGNLKENDGVLDGLDHVVDPVREVAVLLLRALLPRQRNLRNVCSFQAFRDHFRENKRSFTGIEEYKKFGNKLTKYVFLNILSDFSPFWL